MARVFLTPDGRLRSPFRILIQLFTFLSVLLLVSAIQAFALDRNSALLYALGSLVYLFCTAAMIVIFSRILDKKGWREYGLKFRPEWGRDFLIGILLGAFTLGVVALTMGALGWTKFHLAPNTVFMGGFAIAGIAALINLLAIAAGEEFTFRAYEILNLGEGLGGGKRGECMALLLSSAIFGSIHLLNPNASLMAWGNVCLAGLVLGTGYVLSGELALPLGMHFAVGFFEEFVFGFANSGQSPLNSLFVPEGTGPALWSGGSFGPEAGLIMTFVLLVDLVLIYVWTKRSRRRNTSGVPLSRE